MKRITLLIASAAICASTFAAPKAFYVKSGNTYAKYNFGVAEDLTFSNGGTWLTVNGYNETIDLSKIDYISFTAPVDETALTPDASKQRLLDIGTEASAEFTLDGLDDVVCMADEFARTYVNYWIDEKYTNVHDSGASTLSNAKAIMSGINGIVSGNIAATRVVKANSVELYQCSDYYGIFKANIYTHEFERIADADYLEFQYPTKDKSGTYRARFTASADYTDWNETDFVGRIPKTMQITAYRDETLLAQADLTTDVDDANKSATLSMTISVGNYKIFNALTATNSRVTDEIALTHNGKTIITSTANIDGNALTDVQGWRDDVDNTDNGHYEYGSDGSYNWVAGTRDITLMKHFNYATCTVDVLGKLQVYGKMALVGKVYEIMSKDADIDNASDLATWNDTKNTLTVAYADKDIVDSQVSALNNYSDVSFSYDGTGGIQGFFSWYLDEKRNEVPCDIYYDPVKNQYVGKSYTRVDLDYSAKPLLNFPDLTSFAIEDFFSESNFSALVSDYNDIIDTYYTISGNTKND